MLNFYEYHNGDLDHHEIYDFPISRLYAIRIMNPHMDYSSIIHIIKKIPLHAYYYSRLYMRSRWYEAEPYIKTDPNVWSLYCCWFEIND
jgi:hypothetical protein